MGTRANRHFEVITPFACGGRFFGPASALEPRIPAVSGPFWPPPAPGSRGSQKVRHMCTRWLVACQVWPFFAHRRYRSAEILHLPLFLCSRPHIFRRSFSAAPLERCSGPASWTRCSGVFPEDLRLSDVDGAHGVEIEPHKALRGGRRAVHVRD